MTAIAKATRSIVDYLKGSYQEFRQVTWPTREQVVRYTILVTITIIVSSAIITAFDFGMEQLVSRYLIR